MTYVNESALLVQVLTREKVRTLYAERMKRDFPPQELKPLKTIEEALQRGEYACYGAALGRTYWPTPFSS